MIYNRFAAANYARKWASGREGAGVARQKGRDRAAVVNSPCERSGSRFMKRLCEVSNACT